MHENVFAGLPLDETKALARIEPLNCSLFFQFCFSFLFKLFGCCFPMPSVKTQRGYKCELAAPPKGLKDLQEQQTQPHSLILRFPCPSNSVVSQVRTLAKIYFASSSTSKIPNTFPSKSKKYPCQHVPGTANFPSATIPPPFRILSAVSSKFSTSIEHTNAFVPLRSGGLGAGLFSSPPLDPPVSIRQYSTGSPSTGENFQPNTFE